MTRSLLVPAALGAVALSIGIWRIAYVPAPVIPAPAALSAAPAADVPVEWRGRFPNVPLLSHDGRTLHFYDDLVRGNIVVLNFFYIDCEGTCPGVTSTLVEVERVLRNQLSRDLRIVSISLEPERDSPARLKEYAERYGAGPGIVFLTGSPDDVDLVRRAMGFSHPEDPARDLDRKRHAAILRLGNEPEGWWSTCPSLTSPAQVANAIRSLDAPGAGRAGSGALEFPGGVPVEFQSSGDLAARQEFAVVLDRLELLWMSRIPMDNAAYRELILSQLSDFLRLPLEAAGAFRTSALAAVADLARARRAMESFRRGSTLDPANLRSVRAARSAWETYLGERSQALTRLESALPAVPRSPILRAQTVRWMAYLEDPPEPPSLPQDEHLVPIPKK